MSWTNYAKKRTFSVRTQNLNALLNQMEAVAPYGYHLGWTRPAPDYGFITSRRRGR